ncbi:hypothetical protein B0T26DRAFT_511487 [Lasiosphaeria miniovina]|uniref:Uncharacterized protein n=1 Tax=Lasiosphaeria miniovina TaxID=1954250 RepID=A0AA39ZUG5_9PEZI|nr:uncharacterized protein B0T26DRAFT_511487 [Lasiosphaeria miniovina]KAK0703764.1 hypothetical protein B0T26DRAFT_511487 [Lasiosphaeria miniovina]
MLKMPQGSLRLRTAACSAAGAFSSAQRPRGCVVVWFCAALHLSSCSGPLCPVPWCPVSWTGVSQVGRRAGSGVLVATVCTCRVFKQGGQGYNRPSLAGPCPLPLSVFFLFHSSWEPQGPKVRLCKLHRCTYPWSWHPAVGPDRVGFPVPRRTDSPQRQLPASAHCLSAALHAASPPRAGRWSEKCPGAPVGLLCVSFHLGPHPRGSLVHPPKVEKVSRGTSVPVSEAVRGGSARRRR